MTYSQKLQDPRWQKLRLQVFDRDKFTCQLCGDKETTLNVHHERYFKNPWDAPLNDLRTLCKNCHYIVESTKKIDLKVVHVEKINEYCNVYMQSGCNYLLAVYALNGTYINPLIILSMDEISRYNTILKSL